MRARPGRLLPSVIVGGLLISGLALGAGTAAGVADAGTCKLAGITVPIPADLMSQVSAGVGDVCMEAGNEVTALRAVALGLTAGDAPSTDPSDSPAAGNGGAPTTDGTGGAPATGDSPGSNADPGSAGGTPADGANGSGTGNGAGAGNTKGSAITPAVQLPPAGLPAPAPLAAAGPVGALPGLPPLAGVAPAGLASSLFSANAYDPGLLMGSPLGNAASALFTPQADSSVTTVSQAQALAGTDGGGYGTPATIGVIILACLIGFAVRHRVISRMKAREIPAGEYQPRHAAPEPEPATELVTAPDAEPAADEARTLVVLTRR